MAVGEPLLQLRDVTQDYGGLRPLRVKAFDLHPGERVAILGMERGAAEVLVNLVTAASTPRTGEVRAFGRLTTDITDSVTWLDALRAYGLLGPRTVLVEQLTVLQNLALPITLEVDPMPAPLDTQMRERAQELGLDPRVFNQLPGSLPPLDQQRVRLGRALALDPRLLLAEHPSATLERADADALARDMSRIVARRGMAALYITADRAFAQQAADQVVTLKPATGELVSAVGWRRFFG